MKRIRIAAGLAISASLTLASVGAQAASTVGVVAGEEAPASPSAGCEDPLAEPGVHDGVNEVADANLNYRVVVPEGYAEMVPAPLIVWLAAGMGSVEANMDWWRPYLHPAESVFVVSGRLSQATTLMALLDQLSADYCIDTRRVHLMGQSSSANSVARLACEASDRIGSFFAGMAAFSAHCTPERPVPLMATTGDSDRAAVSRSVEAWAEAYGCDGAPMVDSLGSGVTRTAHQGCLADIVLYDVDGASHGFIRIECAEDRFDYCYQNDVFDQLREAERFSSEHPLPESTG